MTDTPDTPKDDSVVALHPESITDVLDASATPADLPEEHVAVQDAPPLDFEPPHVVSMQRGGVQEGVAEAHQRRAATGAEMQAAVNKFVKEFNGMGRLLTDPQRSLVKAARRNVRASIADEIARVKKQAKGGNVMGLSLEHFFVIEMFHDLKREVMQALIEADVFALDEYAVLETATYLRAYTHLMRRGMNPNQANRVEMGLATVGTQEIPVNFSIEKAPQTTPINLAANPPAVIANFAEILAARKKRDAAAAAKEPGDKAP
jgi:hypothetical protein